MSKQSSLGADAQQTFSHLFIGVNMCLTLGLGRFPRLDNKHTAASFAVHGERCEQSCMYLLQPQQQQTDTAAAVPAGNG